MKHVSFMHHLYYPSLAINTMRLVPSSHMLNLVRNLVVEVAMVLNYGGGGIMANHSGEIKKARWNFLLLIAKHQECSTILSRCDITIGLVNLNLSIALFAVCGFGILQALSVWCFVFF
jgi:hypothetical protein